MTIDNICRICLEVTIDQLNCDCTGYNKYVHKHCMKLYLLMSNTSKCDVCTKPFNIKNSNYCRYLLNDKFILLIVSIFTYLINSVCINLLRQILPTSIYYKLFLAIHIIVFVASYCEYLSYMNVFESTRLERLRLNRWLLIIYNIGIVEGSIAYISLLILGTMLIVKNNYYFGMYIKEFISRRIGLLYYKDVFKNKI
jgi:hypothetical protein